MEELINTLSSLSTKDLQNMINVYESMPDGIMKDSMRISLLDIINYVNLIRGAK